MTACDEVKLLRAKLLQMLEKTLGEHHSHKIWDIGKIMQELTRCGYDVDIIISDEGLQDGKLTFTDKTDV